MRSINCTYFGVSHQLLCMSMPFLLRSQLPIQYPWMYLKMCKLISVEETRIRLEIYYVAYLQNFYIIATLIAMDIWRQVIGMWWKYGKCIAH